MKRFARLHKKGWSLLYNNESDSCAFVLTVVSIVGLSNSTTYNAMVSISGDGEKGRIEGGWRMWRPVAMAETRGFKIKRSDSTQDDNIVKCLEFKSIHTNLAWKKVKKK